MIFIVAVSAEWRAEEVPCMDSFAAYCAVILQYSLVCH